MKKGQSSATALFPQVCTYDSTGMLARYYQAAKKKLFIFSSLVQGRLNFLAGWPQWVLQFDRGAYKYARGVCRKHIM